MRYAILSDIHSNLEALTAVLERIDSVGVDKVICLGDLVGYYANPNECLEIVRKRNIHCIAGNHDRAAIGVKDPAQFWQAAKRAIFWTRDHLTVDNLRFLEKLPLVDVIDGQFVIVHGSLYPQPNEDIYLVSEMDVLKNFEEMTRNFQKIKICFFGHTHHSVAYEYHGGNLSKINHDEIKMNPTAFYLLNPGSVGQSRDHDPRAAYLIFDADRGALRFYRVEYDIARCYQKAKQAGLLYREGLLRRSANRLREWFISGKK